MKGLRKEYSPFNYHQDFDSSIIAHLFETSEAARHVNMTTSILTDTPPFDQTCNPRHRQTLTNKDSVKCTLSPLLKAIISSQQTRQAPCRTSLASQVSTYLQYEQTICTPHRSTVAHIQPLLLHPENLASLPRIRWAAAPENDEDICYQPRTLCNRRVRSGASRAGPYTLDFQKQSDVLLQMFDKSANLTFDKKRDETGFETLQYTLRPPNATSTTPPDYGFADSACMRIVDLLNGHNES